MTTYPCGCVNQVDSQWGIMQSVSKCPGHIRASGKMGLEHYRDMHNFDEAGAPRASDYAQEMTSALINAGVRLSRFYPDTPQVKALEIGCGIGLYIPMVSAWGYHYTGLEPDAQAAAFARQCYGADVVGMRFEEYPLTKNGTDLILAAHVLEHLADAPNALIRMHEVLKPGGKLLIIVPDDSDPVNPDHLWFFTRDKLIETLHRIGFVGIKTHMRPNGHEQFIYCYAEKL